MKKLCTQFRHKDYQFLICVELNYQIEKRPNGKVYHRIVTSCLSNYNYYSELKVEDHELENSIKKEELLAKNSVDKLINNTKSKDEILLEKLGFIEV